MCGPRTPARQSGRVHRLIEAAFAALTSVAVDHAADEPDPRMAQTDQVLGGHSAACHIVEDDRCVTAAATVHQDDRRARLHNPLELAHVGAVVKLDEKAVDAPRREKPRQVDAAFT